MAESWKVVEATTARIDLVRGLERRELARPSHPAARALFLQFKAGHTIGDDTIHFIQAFDQGK
ncbi:MAG: hypothetical protein WA294_02760 [Acidobacteriaceae bacterium]